MTHFKRSISLLAVACLLITALAGCNTTYEKAADTMFQVMQITDVHIQNDEKKDQKAFKTISAMVEAAQPDLIVMTGDITSEQENMEAFKTFCTYMEGLAIPWAFTFGNHDAEGNASKQELSDYLETLEHCIYERGDKTVDGMGNYTYNVTHNGKTLLSLIMMDSNMYYPDEAVGGYDRFHENQIQWYQNTVKSIAKQANGDETKVVPSLAFFHIPMREYKTGYDEAKKNRAIISGRRFEKECPSNVDDGMFEAMLELGSTRGVFVGHDHMNNYSVDYKGIRLTYGLSGDHNIYVVPFRGGVLINVKEDGSFTTQTLIRHRGQNAISIGKEK